MVTDARILIVEDNQQVGDFAAQLLADLGSIARRAGNAREALAVLEAEHDEIDIVFSDVVMPRVDGVELCRRIRARWPGLTVVLTSGYSHVLAEDMRDGFPLLQKPYSLDDLVRVMRDAHAQNRKVF